MSNDPETQGEGPYRSGPTPTEPTRRWSQPAISSIVCALGGWGLVGLALGGSPGASAIFMIGVMVLFAALVLGVSTIRGTLQKERMLFEDGAPPPDEPPLRGLSLARLAVWVVLLPIALGVIGLFLLFLACMG